MSYNHKEAFALMTYRCIEGHDELIWNSRDGVTPAMIPCRVCSTDSIHVEWGKDMIVPEHFMQVGQRYWRNGTPQEAVGIVQRRYEAEGESNARVTVKSIEQWHEFEKGWPFLDVKV